MSDAMPPMPPGMDGMPGAGQPSEEEMRQALGQMRAAPVEQLVAEILSATLNQAQVKLGRNDGDYQLMLSICELLVRHMMPTELAGTSAATVLDHGRLRLHDIFERFVAAFYRHHLAEWEVAAQHWIRWPVIDPPEFLPIMVPDVVLTSLHGPSRKIVLDTKFTAKSLLSGRADNLKLDSSHLYQLYAYLRTQEEESAAHAEATGILLYPRAEHDLSISLQVQGHEIRVETIDLKRPWQDIETRLMSLVA